MKSDILTIPMAIINSGWNWKKSKSKNMGFFFLRVDWEFEMSQKFATVSFESQA